MDEEKSLYYLKKIAPTQKEFKSEAAKKASGFRQPGCRTTSGQKVLIKTAELHI